MSIISLTIPSYLASSCGGCDPFVLDKAARDFFVFNLSGLSGVIWSASLSVGNGNFGIGGDVNYRNWDVTTPISALEVSYHSSEPNVLAIFQDLRSGIQYSEVDVGPADNGAQIQVPLNDFALESLNAAEGGSWAVGGSVIPEPASWALMLVGFGAIAYAHRRQMEATLSLAKA